MAERRSTRTKRRPRDEEPPEVAEDELADEPDDELADEPQDELDEPEDELDEPEDELAEEDELADEPEDELDESDDELEEEDSGRRRNDGRGARQRSHRQTGSRLNAAKAGQAALRQIIELTGKEPEGVTGVDRGEDGWVVGVEVVEDRRVPSSSDILAIFEIELDMDGELMSYRRVRRYPRGRGDDEGF
jgi:Gas vesicle synthesis protein GvpO